ncbi:CHAP domain-containing protein [Candidatus Saccharibacteria bacterium]|nr:CHAP domain-containing protein [Candidatus Saccharibacteria bacterium]
MKVKTTTKLLRIKTTRKWLVLVALVIGISAPLTYMRSVFADSYDSRISSIESEIGSYQSEAARLAEQSKSLQQELDSLAMQKNIIQAQIDLSQAKYDKLIADIAENEKKLVSQQDVLSTIIADMSVGTDVTPIEVLAGSDSVGDYVSTQDYYANMQDQLQQSVKDVIEITKQLEAQKIDAERVLNDQKSQRDALAAKEAEQSKLLADTQGAEGAYQQIIGQRESQIADLRAQQAAANAAASRTYSISGLTPGGAGCGGYPAIWCNSVQDSLVDNWGMYNRECVSYTAWKVAASGRYMPYWGGRGNANQWPASARADGISTGSEPQVGSVAIMYIGYYGHAMYVESINSNGTIHVSQFNWRVQGEFSEMDINPNGLTFIYF